MYSPTLYGMADLKVGIARIRPREVKKRLGGRGCPKCGSHHTDSLRTRDGTVAAQFCYKCEYRWLPCTKGCRGYRLDMRAKGGPAIIGCRGCEVPDEVARQWPEAYRAMAKALDDRKSEDLPQP